MSTPKPSTLRRLSTILNLVKTSSPPAPDGSSLCTFLQSAKQKYLSDVRATPSKGSEWTVVMGNEAGDLDSVASSIAYAWVRSEIEKKPSIPLIQIAREDLVLRAENLYALGLAGIHDPGATLLCTTDIEELTSTTTTTTFALVDHNRLADAFSKDSPTCRVVAVIDHHEDEGLHRDAEPRHVQPAGSCASHVANLYPKEVEMPSELATLLLSAILIDTNGLRVGGKAIQADHDAAAYLIPRSTLNADSVSSLSSAAEVKRLSDELDSKKSDVSHLGAWDLLRRDYKEYTYTLNWHPGNPTIKAGLATVPVKLKAWGSDGKREEVANRFMDHRGLSVLGVLTSFRDSGKLGGKGKHRREQAWFVRDADTSQGALQVDDIAARLWKGLEESDELRVEKHKKMSLSMAASTVQWRIYKQGNANATRKATAPLLKNIIESAG
ncbi:hypothetical protein FB45DRAFT_918684 [Roridomyces roridus]|uniref:DHHA2 domain-containing protein n=1 Tax=Roridomyces roridus TaxID=1738132 RepID=A0AAD7FN45_9AGAR|nr:hypothetical protein FB45DRAFT_918684 [Roridomyces roridus]